MDPRVREDDGVAPFLPPLVIPAEAGIHLRVRGRGWIPACARMTEKMTHVRIGHDFPFAPLLGRPQDH
jgi:hypothetical protein